MNASAPNFCQRICCDRPERSQRPECSPRLNPSRPRSRQGLRKLGSAAFFTLALISYRSILAGDMPGGAREIQMQQRSSQSSQMSRRPSDRPFYRVHKN